MLSRMKNSLVFALLILLAGCDYEVPLSKTASFPADAGLAGLWTGTGDDGKTTSLEIKTGETEYTAVYSEKSDALTFNGFEVHENGLRLIQLELKDADAPKYLFVKYELTPDELNVYRLNPEVVSAKCRTAEELAADIQVHRNNPDLFVEPMKFTRAK
jgi:hypothetical protein